MKLLVDMNLSPRWVEALRLGGLDAEHWSAIGRADAPDAMILDYAAQNDRVVFTHDLDFGAILAWTGSRKPSVVQVRADDLRPERTARYVIAAVRQAAGDLRAGALLTIDPGRTRLRILPLVSKSD